MDCRKTLNEVFTSEMISEYRFSVKKKDKTKAW